MSKKMIDSRRIHTLTFPSATNMNPAGATPLISTPSEIAQVMNSASFSTPGRLPTRLYLRMKQSATKD
jgi:hypothetical protein